MIDKFAADEWKIIEEGFDPKTNRFSESIFSLGNEHMGLRGFFEEDYSGDSLPGIYVAGIYYPDKTRVGWWKIGYPEFFAKVVNSTNWIGIGIALDGIPLDVAKFRIKNFRRELDMQRGMLTRSFTVMGDDGKETNFGFRRFLSMAENNIACITVKITPLNHSAAIVLTPYLDGDVVNEDSNFGEKFWEEADQSASADRLFLMMRTKKSIFIQATAAAVKTLIDGREIFPDKSLTVSEKKVGYRLEILVGEGQTLEIQKFVSICTSRDFNPEILEKITAEKLESACKKGYDGLYADHCRKMAEKWADSDVVISGDVKAQQGIRYDIFQLNQTYTGKDPRLNIGPKGFTGEKYGGSTYWDTEAFCFPFYLYTNEDVARNLLIYRYLHLDQARQNARKLGCNGALYPMVTMDGQECHNEWEITFEEIHRNGAIAYAIYHYTQYTGKTDYLFTFGLDVLIEISRYWADRVNFNPRKGRYMILGVTGPNEYENNVNNNWYTNTMASWTLEYTMTALEELRSSDGKKYAELAARLNFTSQETDLWQDIVAKMYRPYIEEIGVFEQNDGYFDKEQRLVKDLSPNELPLNKHWSWDRILRSCFIKQADVIQGLYFFPERFDNECQRQNFDYYEPRTVHESSLSPSIYSIVASRIGYRSIAYQLYLRAARLDLDNYNGDTDDGVHLTSMAGSWAAIVQGFAGVGVIDGKFSLNPYVPEKWRDFAFRITFRGRKLKVRVAKDRVELGQLSGDPLTILISGREYELRSGDSIAAELYE